MDPAIPDPPPDSAKTLTSGSGGVWRRDLSGSGTPAEKAGDTIGPYRLLAVIGEGGFGVVWHAERRTPMVQRVALKVIKAGMDSRAVIARFEQERQALAVMDHPNVARVLDGGITPPELGARPYFVMELVQGEPITAYCDRHRLTIRQRLELFIPVCEAVQHAHMKGIIHRDLKPSNVLVIAPPAGEPGTHPAPPIPKIIDFGVAKAISRTLTDKTIFTEQGQIIGTPEYMSPEQAEMGAVDVDTRTDVYSLGVLLYELLTGSLPFDAKDLRSRGYNEIQRIIREVEPPRPSTRLSGQGEDASAHAQARRARLDELTTQLRRELEWIPLRALRKNREDRYRTPLELADDVRNYLEGRALVAGPESASYRLRKLLRRNRVAVYIGSLTAAAALTVIGTLFWSQRNEARLRRIADDKAAEAITQGGLKDKEAQRAEENGRKLAKALEASELNAAVANLATVESALRVGNLPEAHRRLALVPDRLRGWEWRCETARSDGSLRILSGHPQGACITQFSPHHDALASMGVDGTLFLWRPQDEHPYAVIKDDEGAAANADLDQGAPLTLEFDLRSSRLATLSRTGTARIIDVQDPQRIMKLDAGGKSATAMACSGGGQVTALAFSDGGVGVFDLDTGRLLKTFSTESSGPVSISVSADGSLLAAAFVAGASHMIRVWDIDSGTTLTSISPRTPPTRASAANAPRVQFGPSGGVIASASFGLPTLNVWDARTGRLLHEFIARSRATFSSRDAVDLSPDGRFIARATPSAIWLCDMQAGTIAELEPGCGLVCTLKFSPDGSMLASGHYDQGNGGACCLFDVKGRSPVRVLRGHEGAVTSISFAPDHQTLATGAIDGTVRLWDLEGGCEPLVLRGHWDTVEAIACAADGSRIVTGGEDGLLVVWDQATLTRLATIYSDTGIWGISIAGDGSRACSSNGYGSITTWDLDTGLAHANHNAARQPGVPLAISPDGRRLAAITDQGLTSWTADGDQCLFVATDIGPLPEHLVGPPIAYSPDGRTLLCAGNDGCLRALDAATGAVQRRIPVGSRHFSALALNSTGQVAALADRDSLTIIDTRTWAVSDRIPVSTYTTSIAVDPSASRLVCQTGAGTAVFDLANQSEMLVLPNARHFAFSADGNLLLTARGQQARILNTTVQVWDTCSASTRARRSRAALELDDQMRERAHAAVTQAGTDALAAIRADSALSADRRRALLNGILRESCARTKDEHLLRRIAERYVSSLGSQARRDVPTKIRADTWLPDDLRAAALEIASADVSDPSNLNDEAWSVVASPRHRSEEYAQALRTAEAAAKGAPDQPACLNTLGVAQYRCGKYEESLATLTRSAELHAKAGRGLEPADLTFIAMSQFKLGLADEARASLARLRDLLQAEPAKASEESRAFLLEATNLIQPPSPGTPVGDQKP